VSDFVSAELRERARRLHLQRQTRGADGDGITWSRDGKVYVCQEYISPPTFVVCYVEPPDSPSYDSEEAAVRSAVDRLEGLLGPLPRTLTEEILRLRARVCELESHIERATP
jgi:hypothetical protein